MPKMHAALAREAARLPDRGALPASDRGAPARKGLVALLLAIVPFSQIPLDAYTPALPEMVTAFGTDNATIQNTVTAYMLGMSLMLLPAGLLADALGRRRVLLTGMAVLVVMSLACALATDVRALLAFRFLQGMGGCTCLVVTYAIAADVFRGAELTSISGLLGAAWGLAPVLAPALGGLMVEIVSWRLIFGLIALGALLVAALVFLRLPETLAEADRTPIRPAVTAKDIRAAFGNRRFVCYTLVFSAMGSAQLVFGVVAPFFYQVSLGFSAAAYGLVALGLGGVNLLGELGCSFFAKRTTPRRLAFGAFGLFAAGTLVLLVSGLLVGPTFLSITIGGALVLAGCGTLCPMMYGMALGLFEKNLGLIGGLVSAVCYFAVSGSMAIAAILPETSQAPVSWLYVSLGIVAGTLLLIGLPKARRETILQPG